jgi:hypothetical protein
MIKQTEVKEHRSIWKNNTILKSLDSRETSLTRVLIEEEKIIEEQNISLTKENLEFNDIV